MKKKRTGMAPFYKEEVPFKNSALKLSYFI